MFSVCSHLGGVTQLTQPGGGSVSRGGQSGRGVGVGQSGRGVSPARGWVSLAGGVDQSAGGVGGQPGGGSAKIGQQNEYSLHGGRYASCVHAGGLLVV